MGIKKRYVPGCTCCEAGCGSAIYGFSSLSAWTQQAGTWTSSGGNATTTDNNAILLLTDSPTWQSNFKLYIQSATSALNLKLYFGWEDSSNYWYAEVLGGGFGGSTTMKIVEVVASTPTTHLSVTLGGTSGFSSQWWVCYQNGFLSVHSGSFTQKWYLIEATVPSGQIGFGSSDTSCSVGQVQYYWATSPSSVCRQCVNGQCCDGYDVPDSISVVLADLPSPYDVWNGAYELTKVGADDGDDGTGFCEWQKLNGLADLGGGYTRNFLTVYRIVQSIGGPLIVDFALGYTKTDTTAIDIVGDAEISGSWTTSPCNDQWSTPFSISGTASGTVDEITGVF